MPILPGYTDELPDDPTRPSLSLLASGGNRIPLEWLRLPAINLGDGFLTSAAETKPFRASAIHPSSLKEDVKFQHESGERCSFHSAMTTDHNQNEEHFSISAGVGVGGKVLGASVSGTYNKAATENKDAFKASMQSTIRTGTISIESPRLSLDAMASITRMQWDPNAINTFKEKYGDYYVAHLRLGADAGVMLSTSSHDSGSSENLDTKATVRILWIEAETDHHSERSSKISSFSLRTIAFDTLTGSNAEVDKSAAASSLDTARKYMSYTKYLEDRVLHTMHNYGLTESKAVDFETCRRICESGLVVEIILLPYTSVRDYIVASVRRM